MTTNLANLTDRFAQALEKRLGDAIAAPKREWTLRVSHGDRPILMAGPMTRAQVREAIIRELRTPRMLPGGGVHDRYPQASRTDAAHFANGVVRTGRGVGYDRRWTVTRLSAQ